MRTKLGFGVVARSTGTACAIPAILMPTLAGLQPARAQGTSPPVLSCVAEVTGQDAAGKTLITIRGRFVATRPDGGLIIAVDPSCVAKPVSVPPADKYADAKATIDGVVAKAKEAGVDPKVADRAGAELNNDVDEARKVLGNPANQVAGANSARVQQSAEHPEKGDDAMVAAIAGVAGVCMVASAGICAAAAAAVLPSILPAKISSEDVQGVASILNDINQGKPVTPERLNKLLDSARKYGKANDAQLADLGKLAETGLKIAAENALVQSGVQPDAARRVIELINKAIRDGHFDCDEVFQAAKIQGPIPITDRKFVEQIVVAIRNSRYGAARTLEVRACLNKYFDPNQ